MLKRIKSVLLLILIVIVFVLSNWLQGYLTGMHHVTVPEHIFRYADNQDEEYPTTLGAYYFAELVEKRTNGRIKIVVYHSAQLGSEVEVLDQIQFGGIDFGRVSLSIFAESLPEFNVLLLPYLYRDSEHMWHVLDGEIGADYLFRLEGNGLVGLSWYDAGSRSFYTNRPVRTLEDLKGMDIRVQESTMMSDMVRALGAVPFQIPYGEVYSNLQLKEIDGAENNWPSYESTGHYKVAGYVYRDEHTRVPEIQLMSQVSMEKLSKEDQEIIKECARESALFEREEWKKRESLSEESVRQEGVSVFVPTEEEKGQMQKLCEPLYQKYAGDYMDVIEEIIQTD